MTKDAESLTMTDLYAESVHVWLVMTKAVHALGKRVSQQLLASGLADTDFRVLEALLHKGPLPVNVIGPKVHLNPGSISVAVDRLYSRGLVSRVEDETDRRVRTVSLTPAGRARITDAYEQHAALLHELFAPLSPREKAQLERLLKRVGRAAEVSACGGQSAEGADG